MSLEVDKRLLSQDEWARYRALRDKPAAFGVPAATPRTSLALVAWMVACVAIFAWMMWEDQQSGHDTLAGIMFLVALGPGVIPVFVVLRREVAAWRQGLAPAYLDEIGYSARVEHVVLGSRIRSDADEADGRTYPVTDGAYDPELYCQRGGYGTFAAMDNLGIDDYDTYRNNVLEAD